MKKLLVFLCAMLLVFGMAISARAYPYPYLDEIIAGEDHIQPTGSDYVYLSDGNTAMATLLLESNEWANDTFAIYDPSTLAILVVFQPGDEPGSPDPTQTEVTFNLVDGTAKITSSTNVGLVDTWAYISPAKFGFYIDVSNSPIDEWYTDALLNSDSAEHGLIYDPVGSGVIVAFEDMPSDLWGGNIPDQPDYNDMVVEVGNVAPHTPEPATMLLFGSGLVCLVALGRTKFFKKA